MSDVKGTILKETKKKSSNEFIVFALEKVVVSNQIPTPFSIKPIIVSNMLIHSKELNTTMDKKCV